MGTYYTKGAGREERERDEIHASPNHHIRRTIGHLRRVHILQLGSIPSLQASLLPTTRPLVVARAKVFTYQGPGTVRGRRGCRLPARVPCEESISVTYYVLVAADGIFLTFFSVPPLVNASTRSLLVPHSSADALCVGDPTYNPSASRQSTPSGWSTKSQFRQLLVFFRFGQEDF